jgi:hypothetical protein
VISVLMEALWEPSGLRVGFVEPSRLHFPVDRPLPKAVVKRLVAVRLREADQRSG